MDKATERSSKVLFEIQPCMHVHLASKDKVRMSNGRSHLASETSHDRMFDENMLFPTSPGKVDLGPKRIKDSPHVTHNSRAGYPWSSLDNRQPIYLLAKAMLPSNDTDLG